MIFFVPFHQTKSRAVDGGKMYLRRVGEPKDWEELSETKVKE